MPLICKWIRLKRRLEVKTIQKPRQKTNQPNKTTSEAHRSLSTQKAWEAHTEKIKNLGPPSLPQQDNTVPLLLFYRNNRRQWHPQQPQPQPPPLEQAPQPLPLTHHLLPLPLQPLLQTLHPEEHLQASTIDSGLLWLLLLRGPDQAAEEEEEEEEGEEAAEEGEEAAVEDNQLLSLHSSSSPSHQLLTYELWGRSPESSTEKETKPTHS
jgi:hypothetical protein